MMDAEAGGGGHDHHEVEEEKKDDGMDVENNSILETAVTACAMGSRQDRYVTEQVAGDEEEQTEEEEEEEESSVLDDVFGCGTGNKLNVGASGNRRVRFRDDVAGSGSVAAASGSFFQVTRRNNKKRMEFLARSNKRRRIVRFETPHQADVHEYERTFDQPLGLASSSPSNHNKESCWNQKYCWRLFIVGWCTVFVLVVVVPLAVVLPGNINKAKTTTTNNGDDQSVKNGHTTIYNTTNFTTSPTAPKCFDTNDELRSAVDEYLHENRNQSFSSVESRVARKYGYPINSWCFSSNLTSLRAVFSALRNPLTATFDEPIDEWNTSNIAFMDELFQEATSFNQPLDTWDTSRVRDMTMTFKGATNFNQPLANWDVGRVTTMRQMYYGATSFNQDISGWNVTSVKDMRGMFWYATDFQQDLCAWGEMLPDVSVEDVDDDSTTSSTTINVNNMFTGTSCRSQRSPILTLYPPRPFCSICPVSFNATD